MGLESYLAHQTQAKGYSDSLSKLSEAELEKRAMSDGWGDAQRFVLGKSLVGGSVTGDIFGNVKPGSIAFVRPSVLAKADPQQEVSITLAGPWNFYEEFRRQHGLTLWHPEPPEIALQAGTSLVIPLWLRNETAEAREITLAADLPAAWKVSGGTGKFVVGAKQVAAGRVEIDLPALDEAGHGKQELREVTVRGESNGENVGVLKLRVELRKRALPE
jgi:hypothetical protein